MRIIPIVLLSVFLCGCATTAQTHYVRDGGTEADFNRESYDCQVISATASTEPSNGQEIFMKAMSAKAYEYDKCMRNKYGYHQE